MHLTDLAAACRKSGLKVVEVDGWESRGHGGFSRVDSIICHHTAGPRTGNMPSLNVCTHGRAGLSGPLCNLGLGRDGTVYVIAAGVGWHAGNVRSSIHSNSHAIGIEAEATGVTTWPKSQVEAYAKLCAALVAHYGLSTARVLGHKEVCNPAGRKIDPNFDMGNFRGQVGLFMPTREPVLNAENIAKCTREATRAPLGTLLKKAVAAEVGVGTMHLAHGFHGSEFKKRYVLVQRKYLDNDKESKASADGIPGPSSLSWLGRRHGFNVK